ncbi:CHITIN ELICITOR RECEPTOR KINASE 1-RELATED [Salix viminalis]|uniref:CHITIN ELICITOR RECEPTOR KINASE 1-RELATED n=1 Tax=Salix viminalis TaxID=40686 RepID=A0A9Q0YZ03_SALVM|nr:CHITIN ELICITOR RECEPTOR KINASE 1-RELATED [Salix viminalis]
MNHPARTSLLIPEKLTLPMIQSMFDVLPQDVTREGNGHGYVFIKKNCSCLSKDKVYVTNSTYTVKFSEGYVYDIVINAYDGLAFLPNTTRQAKVGAVVSLRLFCGCSSGLWNYFVSYVMKEGDTVQSLSSRFGVSMDSIETVNGIQNPDNVTVGALYYIPLNSVPGEPYPMENDQPPAPVPAPSHDILSANIPTIHKAHVPYGWIIGGLGIGLVLIVLCIIICVSLKSSSCFSESQGSHAEPPDAKISQKFHILRKQSFCCTSGRSICCKSVDWKQTNGESSSHQITIPKGLATDAFDEKPVVFTYEEILFTTDEFLDSSLLGHGTYGSVYYGHLHDQEVAIKRMTATKTKEFTAEMKILCKVHHTNLVELIGYAASDAELFLIYEYAQKGSLRSHLHDPQNKGHTPLSWIMRAKISDFGLAKLVGKTGEGEATATKVVGTYGYLAPEYLSDGLATTKSDVYAFGVVLFEIISGKEAIIRTEGAVTKNPERRSLASTMLAALRNSPDSMSMSSLKDLIDPNMMDLYPHDCVFKLAMLAKQCVDEDPILRPDMKQVVISLSQIVLSSIEWEATLAGNSQVFSGLVQGR